MANRLTFSIPDTQIHPQLIAELELAADRVRLRRAKSVDYADGRRGRRVENSSAGQRVGCTDGGGAFRLGGKTGDLIGVSCGLPFVSWPCTRVCHIVPRTRPSVRFPSRPIPAAIWLLPASIQRGIWETTNLMSDSAEPGWLAVTCDSALMAEWLCRAIVLENVQARSEGNRLYVPASTAFTLEGEIKSVITVVAKTVHYWEQHVAGV